MATILNFFDRRRAPEAAAAPTWFLDGCSIEVTPRTAAKVEDFRALLPQGTRVYIAHVDGTPIADMVATAKRLAEEGFPFEHLPSASSAPHLRIAVLPLPPRQSRPRRAAACRWPASCSRGSGPAGRGYGAGNAELGGNRRYVLQSGDWRPWQGPSCSRD
jgi:hypothetical protein